MEKNYWYKLLIFKDFRKSELQEKCQMSGQMPDCMSCNFDFLLFFCYCFFYNSEFITSNCDNFFLRIVRRKARIYFLSHGKK